VVLLTKLTEVTPRFRVLEIETPIALITVFAPAPSCLLTLFLSRVDPGVYYTVLGPPDYEPCFPSGWATGSTAYFPPGLYPSGYNAACSSLNTLSTGVETVLTCYPQYIELYQRY
jgi:hypothetical protein